MMFIAEWLTIQALLFPWHKFTYSKKKPAALINSGPAACESRWL
jgi:hypothetical protein